MAQQFVEPFTSFCADLNGYGTEFILDNLVRRFASVLVQRRTSGGYVIELRDITKSLLVAFGDAYSASNALQMLTQDAVRALAPARPFPVLPDAGME